VRNSTALDRLDHVAIAVSSVADAVRWYRERFRCEVAYEDATWALLKFANTQLALVLPEQHPPHIGFVCSAAEKYGALTRHRDGTQSVYVLDPAGNAVEILKPYVNSGGSYV
jgi:catechol 2,3-dioxygenase-like lactoylglutathione lyase family enzyme